MKKPIRLLLAGLRILIGILFLVSGIEKLTRNHENFILVVQSYKVLNDHGAVYVAKVIPWVELALGIFLIVGLKIRASLTALWILVSAFIAVVGSALFRKLPIDDCGCFGDAVSFPLKGILIFDAALWALLLLMIVFHKVFSSFSVDDYFQNKSDRKGNHP